MPRIHSRSIAAAIILIVAFNRNSPPEILKGF